MSRRVSERIHKDEGHTNSGRAKKMKREGENVPNKGLNRISFLEMRRGHRGHTLLLRNKIVYE